MHSLCSTLQDFTRASRRDRFAFARKLRWKHFPGGLKPKSEPVAEALEGLHVSPVRDTPSQGQWVVLNRKPCSLIRLSQFPDVILTVGAQCMSVGPWRKPTGWLSNAPFMGSLARLCPGPSQAALLLYRLASAVIAYPLGLSTVISYYKL